MKFLIDECLHTSLVATAIQRDHEATHVTYRGWSGAPDWDLTKPILDEAFTFVTNNAKDFRRLYGREDIHAGLLILIPSAPPAPAMGNVAPVPAKHRCAAEPRRRCSARPEHRS